MHSDHGEWRKGGTKERAGEKKDEGDGSAHGADVYGGSSGPVLVLGGKKEWVGVAADEDKVPTSVLAQLERRKKGANNTCRQYPFLLIDWPLQLAVI